MKNRDFSAIIAALLGVAIGVLGLLTYQQATQRNKLLKTEYQDYRKLNLILQKIEENYVDSVDRKLLTDAAVEAALAKLDPHSVYLPPVEREESEDQLAGRFFGIGIQFNVPNDTAIVIEVIPGGPAERIGMKPADRILMVDSTVIAGCKFPQDSMVRRIKGPQGTVVNILAMRDGEEIPFEIVRDRIPTHSVDASFMVRESTGYIRLSKFARTTYLEFKEAAENLKQQGMDTLVVDLRDNSGGYFDKALLLSNLFLEKGDTVVYIEGLHRNRESYCADGKGSLKDVALRILINEGTASSSEIVSGAIQDNHRGLIVGRRSFGKGLVQEPLNFTDGSGIRLTVARFYTPSGRRIQKPYTDDYMFEVYKRYGDGEMVASDSMKIEKGGIIPDVFVPLDTTRTTDFYQKCYRKATTVRFASDFFDKNKDDLSWIDDFELLDVYLDEADLETRFLEFALLKDGLEPESEEEWETSKEYMMPNIRALVGRYSKLNDNAFYRIALANDRVFEAALR